MLVGKKIIAVIMPLAILVLIAASHFQDEASLLATLARYFEMVVPGQSQAVVEELTAFLAHREVLGWVLAHRVFEFEWTPPVWVPVVAVGGGAALAWAAGWWGLRGVLRRPVVRTLRESST